MHHRPNYLLIALTLVGTTMAINALDAQPHSNKFQYHREKLPALTEKQSPIGAIIGESNGTVLLGGGVRNSESGDPQPLSDLFVLPSGGDAWNQEKATLPEPLAYSGTAVHNQELIVAGGLTSNGNASRNVFSLTWRGDEVAIHSYPELPAPLYLPAIAVMNRTLYVLGTPMDPSSTPRDTSMQLWSLPLNSGPDVQQVWTQHPSFPGPSRILPVMAGQDDHLFVFSGSPLSHTDSFQLSLADGIPQPSLRDTWRFTPGKGSKPGSWAIRAELPAPIAGPGGTPMLLGQTHLALPVQRSGENHSISFAVYHSTTNSWVYSASPLSDRYQLDTQASINGSNDKLLLLIRDSNTLRPARITPTIQQQTLTNFDWVVISIYMAGVLGMGFYIGRIREDTTLGFFQAGRKIPFWAVGLSLLATNVSSISFMAIPAVAYATNWVRLLNSLTVILVIPFVIYFFLPFFRRLDVSTAYEYLDKRFNLGVRLFGSFIFVLSQLARIGIVVYLPSIALSAATGIDPLLCILAMGVFTTIYTFFGGMTAVVWTDVVQGIVLIGGGIWCIIHIATTLGGFPEMVHTSVQANKFHTFDWRLDPTELVVWVIVLGSFFKVLGVYVSDQTMVQRYLTTRNETEAAKGLWTNLIVITPLGFLFYGLGSCLYAYYKTFPEQLSPGKTDQILPFFIVQQLPAGVSGVIIAAIFAASMSSLDSSINSTSSVCINDFYKRLFKNSNESMAFHLARVVTIITGTLGTLVAIGLLKLDIKYIHDQGLILLGLIGGGLTGLFILGIFSTRTHALGALIGALIGSMIPLIVAHYTDFNFFLFGAIGIISTMILGYLLSLAIPTRHKNLDNLTWWTMRIKKDATDSPPLST